MQTRFPLRLAAVVVVAIATGAFAITACGEEEGGGPPLPVNTSTAGGTSGGGGEGGTSGRVREPLAGACYPKDPFCGIVGSPCLARVDQFQQTKKILRLGQLQITAPKSLANNAVAGIVGNAMTLLSDRDRCHLIATKPGNFNFLIEVDTEAKTLYAGGGLPQKNPDEGYCYVTKTFSSGIETKPVQIPISYEYDETTDTGTMNTVEPFDLAVPIFDPEADPELNAPILLPLRGTQIKNALLTDQGSCIGRFRGEDGELEPSDCSVTSLNAANDDYYPFASGGDLTGYITVADADNVEVKDLKATLCGLLSGQATNGCRNKTTGEIEFGPAANKPDFDSDGDGVNDAYRLAAKISGAGARVNGPCP